MIGVPIDIGLQIVSEWQRIRCQDTAPWRRAHDPPPLL